MGKASTQQGPQAAIGIGYSLFGIIFAFVHLKPKRILRINMLIMFLTKGGIVGSCGSVSSCLHMSSPGTTVPQVLDGEGENALQSPV